MLLDGVFHVAISRRPRLRPPFLLCLLAAWLLAPAPAAAEQDRAQIAEAIRMFMAGQVADGEPEIEVGHLDRRLRLARCEVPLEAFLPAGSRTVGATTVGVRCAGPRPWTVYVPTTVRLYGPALVAARPLPRGTALRPGDFTTARRELSALRGHVSQPEAVAGMVLRRPLSEGDVLSPDALQPPRLVRRGENVIILAQSGGLTVRVKGKALADGTRGELIQVRNTRTQRVIQARVAAAGVVEVSL